MLVGHNCCLRAAERFVNIPLLDSVVPLRQL
jgi:hypothetical protein